MIPKEKAIELVNKMLYCYQGHIDEYTAKQCALIAVDLRLDGDFIFTSIDYGDDSLEYWEKVKEELKKMK